MFIEQADVTGLRQGDIVTGIPIALPRIEDVTFLGRPAEGTVGQANLQLAPGFSVIGKSPTPWLTAQVHATIGPCAVLSQCCDIDTNQNPPPKTFALCRLVPIPAGISKNKDLLELLRANVNPYGGRSHFYGLFYIGSHPKLDAEYAADFAQPLCVRWVDYATVLRRKILQMDDVTRAKFRMKAGAFYGRPTPEELRAGTADPWSSEAPSPTRERLWTRICRATHVVLGKD